MKNGISEKWKDDQIFIVQNEIIELKKSLKWEREGLTLWRIVAFNIHQKINRASSLTKDEISKNNNTIKKPSAKIQEEKRESKASIQEPKDKDWETFLKNLQQADLHLWILLNKRKFIKWEGNAAFISVNNDSVAWKKLNQDVAKKVIETVSNACLKKKIELKIIIDKEPVLTKKKQKNNLNIEKEIEDLGIEGEWDK